MKEPPGDTHSDGSFIVYEMETGQKWAKNAPKPRKMQKNLHDASIKVIVQIWSECNIRQRRNKIWFAKQTSKPGIWPERKKRFDHCVTNLPWWSEWQDLNLRHLAPKASALPTALHPEILFFWFLTGLDFACGLSHARETLKVKPTYRLVGRFWCSCGESNSGHLD